MYKKIENTFQIELKLPTVQHKVYCNNNLFISLNYTVRKCKLPIYSSTMNSLS